MSTRELGPVSRLGDSADRSRWVAPGRGALRALARAPAHSSSRYPVCSLQTQNVQLNKEMTLASNRSLAEGNLRYQPQLDALKARLTQKYQELQVLFEACQLKTTKLGNVLRPSFQSKEWREGHTVKCVTNLEETQPL